MQTLVFNTTEKTATLYEGHTNSAILCDFNSIPTVKVVDGHYEVRHKDSEGLTYPILRVPISNTNMIIKK
jgi:hypothetical protein